MDVSSKATLSNIFDRDIQEARSDDFFLGKKFPEILKNRLDYLSKNSKLIISEIKSGSFLDDKKEVYICLMKKMEKGNWECFIPIAITEIEFLIKKSFKKYVENKRIDEEKEKRAIKGKLLGKFKALKRALGIYDSFWDAFEEFLKDDEEKCKKEDKDLESYIIAMRNRFCHGEFDHRDYTEKKASLICYLLFFIELMCFKSDGIIEKDNIPSTEFPEHK